MTTNTDELLARMAELLRMRRAARGSWASAVRETLAEYDALPQRPEGAAVTFEQAWAAKEREGYRYGRDALEQVRFGWELRGEVSSPASAVAEPVAYMTRHDLAFLGIGASHCAMPAWNNSDSGTRVALYAAPHPAQAATVSDETTAEAEALDFENIGRAFVDRLPKEYAWDQCPTEYVVDLHNALSDLLDDHTRWLSEGVIASVPGTRTHAVREAALALASSPAAPAPVIPESEKGR